MQLQAEGASWAHIIFPQKTQKILATDKISDYSWLKLIILILSFLDIFSLKITFTYFS